MPLYQLFCDKCFEPYEVTMRLKEYEKFLKGEEVLCPRCKEPLRMLMCPPKRIRIN